MLTNKLALPKPFVDAVSKDYEYKDKRYSTTSILKGVREAILQRRHQKEIEEDVANYVWAIFGSAVHQILENSEESETEFKEAKVEMVMPNGYTLSGIIDLFDAEAGVLTDYKTASVWKVIYDEWDDYRKQLLIYAYLLREAGFDVHTGEIVALLKDHSKAKVKIDSTYPQFPVHIKYWEFNDNDFEEIGMWLEQKFLEIEAAEALSDDELPVCTPEERWATPEKWACYKNANKKATKLCDSEQEAQEYIEAHDDGKTKWRIEHRPGTDKKCEEYCSVREFCKYYQEVKSATIS